MPCHKSRRVGLIIRGVGATSLRLRGVMLEVSQGSFPRGGTTLGFIAESFWDFRSLASIKIRVRCSIFPGAFVLLPRFSQRKSGNNVKGLLSPALSSKGGEGEEPALAVRLSTGFRLLAA